MADSWLRKEAIDEAFHVWQHEQDIEKHIADAIERMARAFAERALRKLLTVRAEMLATNPPRVAGHAVILSAHYTKGEATAALDDVIVEAIAAAERDG